MDTPKLVIRGLSELDAEELRESLEKNVEIIEPEIPEGTVAEPATIAAIVFLTPLVIGALTVWLSKKRRSSLRKESFRIEYPDGRVVERKLEIRSSSEEEAKAEMAAEFGKWAAEAPTFNIS